jgi:hypothetical protein
MFFFGEFFFSFSLFAGFYYWIGKFTGLQYLETLGHIQIKSSFLGVEERICYEKKIAWRIGCKHGKVDQKSGMVS